MHVFMTPKEAASVLRCNERTVRNRIRRGAITHVVTNGCDGNSARYIIDMTLEYGIGGGDGEGSDARRV